MNLFNHAQQFKALQDIMQQDEFNPETGGPVGFLLF